MRVTYAMKWYERHPTDYKEATWHLTLAEHGAYTLLLDHYYSSGAALPESDRALSSICACGLDEWLSVKENVLAFFDLKRGKYFNKKCESILNKAAERNSGSAKRVAKYRKNKKDVTHVTPVSNAPTLHNITEHKKKEKRLSQIPKDWVVTEALTDYAKSKGFMNGKIADLQEGFKLHFEANGGVKKDWDKAFQTWVRNAIKFGELEKQGTGKRVRA